MGRITRIFIYFLRFLVIMKCASASTYIVRVGTGHHVNVVDDKFLSFTVDPKYLFSSSEKYNSQESVCMASSLTPAYIRIAGPSTSHMTFHNSTITFTDLSSDLENATSKFQEPEDLAVTHSQWRKFVQWAKLSGFDLVFALNNEEQTESGLWDPNTALNILTMADKAGVGELFWQLGYECRNQSIEDYLNDLETLRVITETFPRGAAREWRVVGGDVTRCLHTDSKSDFKDYVTLSNDMLDAVLLNGNSSAQELERMSEVDRLKLLKRLSQSTTPLWLTESPQTFTEATKDPPPLLKSTKLLPKSQLRAKSEQQMSSSQQASELHRAADWMTSLGYSARNGFAVNFRELIEEELYEPTLSFYMALLFKNLVGERVLDVDMEASEAIVFAHCTSLRHQPVPGAVTLYGVNMDEEPARFSVKLSKREEGGDIMQFILGHDLNGNIVVNGRAMYHEGDIRPIVRRLRPYKTLLINLPPKSFGFWVLANTNVDACHNVSKSYKKEFVEAPIVIEDDDNIDNKDTANSIKTKRSSDSGNYTDTLVNKEDGEESNHLKKRIVNLNKDLENVHKLLETKVKKNKEQVLVRRRREVSNQDDEKRKLRKQVLKHRGEKSRILERDFTQNLPLLRKLFGNNFRPNNTRLFRSDRARLLSRVSKNKVNKRNSNQNKVKPVEYSEEAIAISDKTLNRKRRNVLNEKQNLSQKVREDISLENEIDLDSKQQKRLMEILHKIHEQLRDLPTDNDEYIDYADSKDEDHIEVKTKLTDDEATINYKEKTKQGLVKSTISNVVNVLGDLNKNLNRFWKALNILE